MKGDKIINTIIHIIRMAELKADNYFGIIEVQTSTTEHVKQCLRNFTKRELLSEQEIALEIENKIVEKFDIFLPDELLTTGYIAKNFDFCCSKRIFTQ